MRAKSVFVLTALRSGSILSAGAAREPPSAIVGRRIVTGTGAVIEDGVIVIRDDLIEAVGLKTDAAVPGDADVIHARGLMAYPGFIDSYSTIFFADGDIHDRRTRIRKVFIDGKDMYLSNRYKGRS